MDPSQRAYGNHGVSGESEKEQVAALIPAFPGEKWPGDVCLPNIHAQAEVVLPRDAESPVEKACFFLQEGSGEGVVGMIIGKEKAGAWGMDYKDDAAPVAILGMVSQFQQMPPSPGRNGVREHGEGTAEEGAGFYFEEDLFVPLFQQEVEAAAPQGEFPLDNFCGFHARDSSLLQEEVYDIVCFVGMEEHRDAFPLHRDSSKWRRPLREGDTCCQRDQPSRNEQFP